MACVMVWQAVRVVLQSLLSLPFCPLTYHVLARAAGVRQRRKVLERSLAFIRVFPFEFGYGKLKLMRRPGSVLGRLTPWSKAEGKLSVWEGIVRGVYPFVNKKRLIPTFTSWAATIRFRM